MVSLALSQVFFWFSQFSLFMYLGLKARRIDIFSLAGGTLILVSLPLWLGTRMKVGGLPSYRIPFAVYFSLGLLSAFLFVTAALVDKKGFRPIKPARRVSRFTFQIVNMLLATACVGSFFLLLHRLGPVLLFGASKRDLMDNSAFTLTFFTSICTVLSCWLFFYGGRFCKCIAIAILLFVVVLGFRSPIVIAGLTLVLLYCRTMRPVSIFGRRPIIFPILVVGSIGVIGLAKPLYGVWKAGDMSDVVQVIQNDGIGELMQRGFEFMNTQYTYVAIVDRDFHTDGGTILRGPLSFLPIPRSYYTTSSNEFNELYQPTLFPRRVAGMAANPFAEFYAGAGLLGVAIFEFLFVFVLIVLNKLIKKPGSWVVIWSLMGVLVAFYIHRNAMGPIFGFLRNSFWPFALCLWLAGTLSKVGRRSSRHRFDTATGHTLS